MLTLIFIVTPIFFVVAGALAALTLSSPLEAEETERSEIRVAEPVMMPAQLDLDAPFNLSPEEALTALEEHLRRERTVAASFARNPSQETLWMN